MSDTGEIIERIGNLSVEVEDDWKTSIRSLLEQGIRAEYGYHIDDLEAPVIEVLLAISTVLSEKS